MNKAKGVNKFFSERDLIETFFQELGLNWHLFKSEYETDTYERKCVSPD